jgi:uncharacterized membrane protein YidH (DUF202 family)
MASITPPHRPPIDWDDGVASERTMLAWQRTALSTTVIALLVIRAGLTGGPLALGLGLGSLLIAVAAWEWLFSRRVYVEHARPQAQGAPVHEGRMAALAISTLIVAAGSAVLALNT